MPGSIPRGNAALKSPTSADAPEQPVLDEQPAGQSSSAAYRRLFGNQPHRQARHHFPLAQHSAIAGFLPAKCGLHAHHYGSSSIAVGTGHRPDSHATRWRTSSVRRTRLGAGEKSVLPALMRVVGDAVELVRDGTRIAVAFPAADRAPAPRTAPPIFPGAAHRTQRSRVAMQPGPGRRG